MTQEKATKRPWCVAVETEAEAGLTITIPVEEWEPDLANADLIVAAVNERDELLSEAAELRRALEMIVCHGCKNRLGWNETSASMTTGPSAHHVNALALCWERKGNGDG